ncbi:MAG: hypothetical protein MUE85_07345 [Microscillaceae bacterium]|jgi:hypothetical protein|nr:hypothetical protein [Microscillaceae bacterium]
MKQVLIHLFFNLSFLCVSFSDLLAQTEKFDAFTYIAPKGWRKELAPERVMYEGIRNGKFAQVYIWSMKTSLGTSQADFDYDWNSLIVKNYAPIEKPQIEQKTEDGWQVSSAAFPIKTSNLEFVAMLMTFTGQGKTFSISVNFNDEGFLKEIEDFISSINIDKVENLQTTTTSKNTPQNQTTTTKSNSKRTAIQYTTTNFDDGWTAIALDEYVRMNKGSLEVRLYYPDNQIDNRRPQNTSIFEPYYWQAKVNPEFNVGQVQVREKEAYSMGQYDIWESYATDKNTGKKSYLAMTLAPISGSFWVVVILANDQNTLRQNYPNYNSCIKMRNYNKFAVDAKDLVGKWKGGDNSFLEYYNAYSGSYAGSESSAMSIDWTFNNNGTYESTYWVVAVKNGLLAQNSKSVYKGNYSVNYWTLKANNRSQGDPGEFNCQFEAVRGGYILFIQNKKFTSLTEVLFKNN